MLATPERLSERSRSILRRPQNELMLSAASAWEIAIKHGLGRLQLPEAPADYIPRMMEHTGITALPIHHRHALHVASLPLHHRDPFDRLLVAQAQLEGMPVLTADRRLAAYEVDLIQA